MYQSQAHVPNALRLVHRLPSLCPSFLKAHVPNALHLTHSRTFPCPSFLRLTFQKSAPRCERFFMHFSPGARLHLWWCRSPGMGDWVQERKTEICSLRFFEPEWLGTATDFEEIDPNLSCEQGEHFIKNGFLCLISPLSF